jgi:hypothetical protein
MSERKGDESLLGVQPSLSGAVHRTLPVKSVSAVRKIVFPHKLFKARSSFGVLPFYSLRL